MLPAAHAKRGRSCRRQGFFHGEHRQQLHITL
nr:MAG TPA: hypothetical protein [Caudoviricetes sp.]